MEMRDSGSCRTACVEPCGLVCVESFRIFSKDDVSLALGGAPRAWSLKRMGSVLTKKNV